jgi:hypothetical protein
MSNRIKLGYELKTGTPIYIEELIGNHKATPEEIQSTYDHILMELLQ